MCLGTHMQFSMHVLGLLVLQQHLHGLHVLLVDGVEQCILRLHLRQEGRWLDGRLVDGRSIDGRLVYGRLIDGTLIDGR